MPMMSSLSLFAASSWSFAVGQRRGDVVAGLLGGEPVGGR
jgi:hypothetical protein